MMRIPREMNAQVDDENELESTGDYPASNAVFAAVVRRVG